MVESIPSHLGTTRFFLVRVARNGLSVSLFVLLAYYALFRLPFRFPPRQQLMSASYTFGFNNGVAIVAMMGLLGAVTVFYLLHRGKATEPPIRFAIGRTLRGRRMLAVAFGLVALFYAALTFALYLYNVHAAPQLMWETRHLLHRTWLMDVYGLHPYTEVAAEYGPVITYAPLYMYWLLKPLGASRELAYFTSFLLLQLAGLWCVSYVLSSAVMPARGRLVAFVILAVAGFELYMGVNGVLVRYLLPFASLLFGHRALAWMGSHQGHTRYWVGTTAIVLLLSASNVLLSPDTGVAFAIAWLGYGVLMIRRERRVLIVSLIALIIAALLCWIFLPVAYYGTLLRFSEGANNWPLLPAPHLVLYILTLFMIVPTLLAASVREWATGDIPGAAMCGALGLLCIVMAPGALGRCDPPHVLNYGIGASMLLMIRLANISRAAFAAYVAGYAGVFMIWMQVVNLQVYYQISPQVLLSRDGIARVSQRLRTVTSTSHPTKATLSALDRYPRLGLPFASFGDPAVEKYVLSRRQLEPEYYVSIVGVYNAAALERKLRDVGKAEYLLVPRGFTTRALGNPCAGYLKNLRAWFLYPAKLPCRADPLDPMTTLRLFIADHYIPVKQVGSWLVMRRISNVSPVQHDH
jgi:hypothetical protein